MSSTKIIIYSNGANCKPTKSMVQFLKSIHIPHRVINVENNRYVEEWLAQEQYFDLPLAFDGNHKIGGFQDVKEYFNEGIDNCE